MTASKYFRHAINCQSLVWKKAGVVHFTTKLCKLNTPNRHKESHNLCKIRPTLTTLCMLDLIFFEVFCTFLGFSFHEELWVNISAAILFGTVDLAYDICGTILDDIFDSHHMSA